jgi:hypothetical protein
LLDGRRAKEKLSGEPGVSTRVRPVTEGLCESCHDERIEEKRDKVREIIEDLDPARRLLA